MDRRSTAAAETPPEIARFAEHHFRHGPALPRVATVTRDGPHVWAALETALPLTRSHLAFSTDSGRWPERTWYLADAPVERDTIAATVPLEATAHFLAVEDAAGSYAGTPYEPYEC